MSSSSNSTGDQRTTAGFPAATRPEERAAARAREAAFPYRFPRDSRQLGGKFSVDENRRRLLRYF